VSRRAARGTTLLDLLVGTSLALGFLAALTAALGAGGRVLGGGGARAEAEDTAMLAVEAFVFDVRRAGWDPAVIGTPGLVEARPDRLAITADLDGNGAVDASSEESVRWVCAPALRRLSRLVGAQSLPLADRVVACAFRYLDAAGSVLPAPPGGLDAAGRAAVRAIALDVALEPAGLSAVAARTTLVALRRMP
jgi:hypothetical protein